MTLLKAYKGSLKMSYYLCTKNQWHHFATLVKKS